MSATGRSRGTGAPSASVSPLASVAQLLRRATTSALVRFAAVGVTNTILSLGAYAALTAAGAPPSVAAAAAFAIGAANGYRLNRSWTFRAAPGGPRMALRYVGVQGIGAALSAAGVALATVDLGVQHMAAEVVVLPAVTLTTFVLSRRLVFVTTAPR